MSGWRCEDCDTRNPDHRVTCKQCAWRPCQGCGQLALLAGTSHCKSCSEWPQWAKDLPRTSRDTAAVLESLRLMGILDADSIE